MSQPDGFDRFESRSVAGDNTVKSNAEIINSEIPEQGFFSLKELAACSPFSADYWSRRVAEGEVKAVQHNARRQGSRIRIPRGEVVRHLAGLVR